MFYSLALGAGNFDKKLLYVARTLKSIECGPLVLSMTETEEESPSLCAFCEGPSYLKEPIVWIVL